MTTRRDFLKGTGAATGVMFCTCRMLDTARAQQVPRHLPVMVNGKRIKTVDVHSHCLFHESLDLVGEDVKKFSHALRDFRNYIHPFQQMASQFNPDQHTAKICWQVLQAAITQLSK